MEADQNSFPDSAHRHLDRRSVLAASIGGVISPILDRRARGAPGVRVLHSLEQLGTAYDYIIVGAGSAGCVLAYRLGVAGRRVLLVEAGGPANLAAISDPPAWPQLQGSAIDWRYATVPQPGLGNRIIACPRGKVVGGSSVINALAYQRGHPAVYNRWPETWQFADLLPYFKRAETFSGGANEWHGGDGPLHVLSLADVADRTPVATAFIEAAQELGFPATSDIGGALTTGVGWNQLSIKGHVRSDAATAYLESLAASTVDLLVGTAVLGLAIEHGRCTGVRVADRLLRPEIEVLLCAGAIDSPRLLMLSGIGPASDLKALGIRVAIDAPEVGHNLADHLLVAGVAYTARREVPRSHYNHADALLYVPRNDPDNSPDVLIMCLSLPFVLPSVGPLAAPAYVLVPCLMRPHSQGTVTLASNDPLAPALIDPRYLAESGDTGILAEGIRIAREIGAAAPFSEWRATEVYPGPGAVSASELQQFIVRAANSFHHPVGTCRIGSVVDTMLRVRGVSGLRVVDASVIPEIPQAMINAATIAIAERASDLILDA